MSLSVERRKGVYARHALTIGIRSSESKDIFPKTIENVNPLCERRPDFG